MIDAMKQALEALTKKSHDLHSEWGGPYNGQTKLQEMKDKAITALRQAIEQAEKKNDAEFTVHQKELFKAQQEMFKNRNKW